MFENKLRIYTSQYMSRINIGLTKNTCRDRLIFSDRLNFLSLKYSQKKTFEKYAILVTFYRKTSAAVRILIETIENTMKL